MLSFANVPQSARRTSSPQRREAAPRLLLRAPQRLNRSACACGGTCPHCGGAAAATLQPKLTVNEPGDAFEQEADRVADQIVNGSGNPSTQSGSGPPTVQRMCADCEEEEEESVQRKSDSGAGAAISPEAQSYIQSMDGGGASLSEPETQYFEPRFGRSFADVKIHTGGAADKAAKSIDARAFTVGSNIAFANGEYDSGSDSGRRLLAHELTHTVQQSSGADTVQRGSAGLLGGKCCNPAAGVEWALVGAGVWKKLASGECTGSMEDCDGMTCGGGFYHVDNLQKASCSTPRHDDAVFAPRRWTPTSAGADAHSPTAEGSTGGDTPPGYVYDAAAAAPAAAGGLGSATPSVTWAGLSFSATATYTPCTDCSDGLEVIQVAWARGGPTTVGSNTTTFPPQVDVYDTFVDGGKNSPGGANYSGDHPYYIGLRSLPASYGYNRAAGSAGSVSGCTVSPSDRPSAANSWNEAYFETVFVCLNYKGKGKDKLMDSVKWGFINKGVDHRADPRSAGAAAVISAAPSSDFTATLTADYPTYSHV